MISKEELLNGYDIRTIALIFVLVCIGPLPGTGSIPIAIALVLSLFRMIKYDARTYIVDMVVLLPLSNIYKLAPATPSVYLYLLLVGCIIFTIKQQVRIRLSLFITLLFLFLISGYVMDAYVSIAAAIFFTAIYSTNLSKELVPKIAIFFCISVAVSTLWAILLTPTGCFEPYILEEMHISKGSDLLRFKGLFVDPNYLGTFLLMAITIVFQLYLNNLISLKSLLLLISVDISAGLLTFSKSFLLTIAALMFLLCYFVWKNKSTKTAISVSISLIICSVYALSGSVSSVNAILERFEGQTDMNELTTGRSDLWERYYIEIISSLDKFFFGHGLDAPLLIQGSHNLYLETLYYVGLCGLVLLILLFYYQFRPIMIGQFQSKNEILTGALTLVVFLVLYWSLQGLFSFTTYVQMCIALSMFLIPLIHKSTE